jgi:hypothetical protein
MNIFVGIDVSCNFGFDDFHDEIDKIITDVEANPLIKSVLVIQFGVDVIRADAFPRDRLAEIRDIQRYAQSGALLVPLLDFVMAVGGERVLVFSDFYFPDDYQEHPVAVYPRGPKYHR